MTDSRLQAIDISRGFNFEYEEVEDSVKKELLRQLNGEKSLEEKERITEKNGAFSLENLL